MRQQRSWQQKVFSTGLFGHPKGNFVQIAGAVVRNSAYHRNHPVMWSGKKSQLFDYRSNRAARAQRFLSA
jgi:hypothetical protein